MSFLINLQILPFALARQYIKPHEKLVIVLIVVMNTKYRLYQHCLVYIQMGKSFFQITFIHESCEVLVQIFKKLDTVTVEVFCYYY